VTARRLAIYPDEAKNVALDIKAKLGELSLRLSLSLLDPPFSGDDVG
jgi:hypothetical protein